MNPLIAAGGTFALATLAGLMIGSIAWKVTGNAFAVPIGLFAGLALGGYAAVRFLMRAQ